MVLTGQALRNYIIRRSKALGLDPLAVLAIATVEGGFGGAVGDHGTSFGPFQLHVGGALPKGMSGAQAKAWAQSAAGVNYALSHIARVAGGLTGRAAVSAIASKFERPADVQGEIDKAMSVYGGKTGNISAATNTGASAQAQVDSQAAELQNANQGQQSAFYAVSGETPDVAATQPAIYGPGQVPVQANLQKGPMADTWKLLAAQPLASQETQLIAQRMNAG